MAEQLKPTSAADFRRRFTFTVKIDSTLTVELRRMDMMTMLLNNAMPLPMLDSAMNFEAQLAANAEKRKADGLPPQTQLEQYAQVDKTLMRDMLDAMRQYAIIHVVKPVIVQEDDGNPEHIPVTMLTSDQLLGIFYASPEGEEKEAPVINKDEATEFRGPQPLAAAHARPVGAPVRPEAELLDLPERKAISA
jgi:hypothetical protein